ncbi:hypothetical protein [Stratiformator vulcanicus]|uniref:Nicotinamidase/pyrazinamidase n=1 Tax=Stratiformator vulcanicus TaxID=2527980 RepID=A0A517R5H0_9PLAN|nr:hypothetical protein [Stratiformator vulcanicus]QDT39122.1 hypothetical protein Pan189_35240 [Stratiformator vulcanicus]
MGETHLLSPVGETHLLIIDPQNDFFDPEIGSLFVTGADADMRRLADLIDRAGESIDQIHVTLDSHHPIHVAHPVYWRDTDGHHPKPFTIISAEDIENGRWIPTESGWLRGTRPGYGAIDYLRDLARGGRSPLCIWPPHCLIGHRGHNVSPPLHDALRRWEESHSRTAQYILKGSNPHTEHYGAVAAEVPDPTDVSTQVNTKFVNALRPAETILVAGEAGSHCVAATVTQLADIAPEADFAKKTYLLDDAVSPVPGFESAQSEFAERLKGRGMRTARTTDF